MNVNATLLWVLVALIPSFLSYSYFLNAQFVLQITLLVLLGLGMDLFFQFLRGSVINRLALIATAIALSLLGLCLPPGLPLWLLALGAALTIGLGRELFGGFAQNIFNPAMLAYAILLLSFPSLLDTWSNASWHGVDASSGATPLSHARAQKLNVALEPGTAIPWMIFNLAALCGGIIMLGLRVIRWHIPCAVLAGICVPAMVFHYVFDQGLSPMAHLFSGATMLAAFFIATDPISAATSYRGRLIYGAMIGVLIYLIREFGSFPDGVAFAVLIGNIAVPSLDSHRLWRRG